MNSGPDIGRHLGRAFEATKRNFPVFFGAVLVAYVLGIVTLYVMFCGLMGATVVLFARTMRGERLGVGDLFEIAGESYLRTFGAYLLLMLLTGGMFIAVVGLPALGAWLIASMVLHLEAVGCILLTVAVALPFYLAAFCWQYWLMVRWLFVIPLMVDTGMSFREARATSVRWVTERGGFWMHLLFVLVAGLVAGAGELACCIGLIFTIPLAVAMVASLYDEHFMAEGRVRPPLAKPPAQ